MTTNGMKISLNAIQNSSDIYGLIDVAEKSTELWHSFTMVSFSMVGGFDFVPIKSQGVIQKESDESNWAIEVFKLLGEKHSMREI